MKTIQLFITTLIFIALILHGHSQSYVKDIKDLKSPIQNAVPDVNGKILISGELDEMYASGENRNSIEVMEGWPVYGSGEAQRGGIYCDLDEDPELEIVYNIGNKTYAWDYDGTLLPGWPQEVQLFPSGAPAFGDVDGDGKGEIVVSSRQVPYSNEGWLYVFEADGSITSGFPVYLNGGAVKTPVLADLDADNAMEIIIEESNYPQGFLTVYGGDGHVYPGFPFEFDGLPGSAVAVGDITGDDIPEIVAESYFSVYAFDNNGNVLEGFPYTPGNDRVFSYSSPVLADLDGDGLREIICGDHQTAGDINGAVHILKNDGSLFPGWPQYTSHWVYGPPSILSVPIMVSHGP
ncbi:MAG: VCBS repeat-containing protein [Bacteroidota bacterium]